MKKKTLTVENFNKFLTYKVGGGLDESFVYEQDKEEKPDEKEGGDDKPKFDKPKPEDSKDVEKPKEDKVDDKPEASVDIDVDSSSDSVSPDEILNKIDDVEQDSEEAKDASKVAADNVTAQKSQLDDIESKVSSYESKIDSLEQKLSSALENLQDEVEKKSVYPNSVETLKMASKNSYPYNITLDDYFKEKFGEDIEQEVDKFKDDEEEFDYNEIMNQSKQEMSDFKKQMSDNEIKDSFNDF